VKNAMANQAAFPLEILIIIVVKKKSDVGLSAVVKIYNAKDQQMLEQIIGNITSDPFRIDLGNYVNGIYTITVKVVILR